MNILITIVIPGIAGFVVGWFGMELMDRWFEFSPMRKRQAQEARDRATRV